MGTNDIVPAFGSSLESLPLLESPASQLPEELRAAFENSSRKKLPAWLSQLSLPPVVVCDKRLSASHIETMLSKLKEAPVGSDSKFVATLKKYAELPSLDFFASRLLELWIEANAPLKDLWALAAIAHLGGDISALKLTPFIRSWPSEAHYARAVLGLECLRAIGSNEALMALNGIAEKDRSRALMAKAQSLMSELAKARGISPAQLGDQFTPRCGLDERGSYKVDLGTRQVHFLLGPDLRLLSREVGGKMTVQFAAKATDDPVKAQVAALEWKFLKKGVKDVLEVQAGRLENAMLARRRWSVEAFQEDLLGHPIVSKLIPKFVFANCDSTGKILQTFQVTHDQIFVDSAGREVELSAGCSVELVHPLLLDALALATWTESLSRRGVVPPFKQFSRSFYRPLNEEWEARKVVRFQDIDIDCELLHSSLRRLGFAESSFYELAKYFPFANTTVVLEYAGRGSHKHQIRNIRFMTGHVTSTDDEPDLTDEDEALIESTSGSTNKSTASFLRNLIKEVLAKPDVEEASPSYLQIWEVNTILFSEVVQIISSIISKGDGAPDS